MNAQSVIITHNVAAMRAEPDGSAEMVSQAIQGDEAILKEEKQDYALIQTMDGYEGWVLRHHLRLVAPDDPFLAAVRARSRCAHVVYDPVTDGIAPCAHGETRCAKLVFGTRLLRQQGGTHTILLASGARVNLSGGKTIPLRKVPVWSPPLAVTFAEQFIGTPYLWGGTTSFGFDCSGFVQRIYSFLGVLLPRDAYLQSRSPLGDLLPEGAAFQPGDLIFFCGDRDPRGRGITHVGMAYDANHFIHASGKEGVAVTPFSDSYARRTFRCAWRYRIPTS